jgi:DNA-binding CsgD family transcriptional regulator
MEFSLKKKDGSVFPSENTAIRVRDQSGLPVIHLSVVRDITLQKRTMESLQKKHRELLEKTKRLDEMNTALKVLLEQREKEKKTSEEQLMDNITGFIIPYLDKIRKTELQKTQKDYVDTLESNLRNIVTPYNHRMSAKLMRLSPTETRVADLVIKGYRIKEMAGMMNVSARTIEFHRDNIRAKLGIKGKKINLKTYLTNI